MAFCPKCGAQIPDGANVCPQCGAQLAGAPAADPNAQFDHTAEFSAKDVSDNKCYAVLPYLLGIVGILVTALISKESPFVQFHLRQAIKFTVVSSLLGICTALLVWTLIVPLAAGICFIIITVLKIIVVFQIFQGKSIEPAIIRNLGFLR